MRRRYEVIYCVQTDGECVAAVHEGDGSLRQDQILLDSHFNTLSVAQYNADQVIRKHQDKIKKEQQNGVQ